MTKSFYCWQCKYFRADDVETLRSGRCHRFAPHSLDYYGFSGVSGGSTLTTKGDLLTFDTADVRLPVGPNGQIIYADSSAASGLRWDDAPETSPLPYITHGVSEGESSTTSTTYQQKLRVTFEATSGVRYKIEWYYEPSAHRDEDVDTQVQINDTNTICEGHFKNFSQFSELWEENCAGHYITNSLTGNVNIDIDFRNGYGNNTKRIRRARILVTRLDGPATALLAKSIVKESVTPKGVIKLAAQAATTPSAAKFAAIYDGGPGMWCGQFRITNKVVPPLPPAP